MSDLFVSWLISERDRYRDRCGDPTRDDVRACGVGRRQIRDYLKGQGWHHEHGDTGDTGRRQWSDGAPEWHHEQLQAVVSLDDDVSAITALAYIEKRSPWVVLDECAYYAGERAIYHEDVLIAYVHGAMITLA